MATSDLPPPAPADPTLPDAVPDDPPFVTRQALRGPAWFAIALPWLPVVLLRLLPDLASAAGAAAALRALGLSAGLLGYVSFAVSLVLGARIPALERLFSSLDRLYRFHRRLGELVGVLLVVHVGLMLGSAVAGSGDAAALLRPDPGWRVFSGVLAAAAFAAVLAATLLGRLHHEAFLRVHRLFGIVFALGALHALRVPAFAGQSPWLNGYLLVVTAAGLVAWTYRSGLGRTLVRRVSYEVADVRPLPSGITELVLDPVDEPLRFSPGQLVFLGLRDDAVGRELHPFSITSAPGDPQLRLAVKAVGDFTGALPQVGVGAWARVEGPYGGFWAGGARHPRQVWLAGGIGVTPFLSMARSLPPDDDTAIDFYYCTEDAEAAVFLDEMLAIADRRPRLRVIPIRADDLGFLTADDVRAASGDLHRTHVYLCGPPPMVDALISQMLALGVPRSRIHHEEFRMRRA